MRFSHDAELIRMRREACVLADQIDMPIGFGGSFDGSRIWTIKKS